MNFIKALSPTKGNNDDDMPPLSSPTHASRNLVTPVPTLVSPSPPAKQGKRKHRAMVEDDVRSTIDQKFKGAMTNAELRTKLEETLKKRGFGRSTLLTTSLCCDEVNRELEFELREVYGDHFSMGGLAGFPFGGATSFGAMAHHIPDGGSCLVVYGPHVGVDADGNVGKVNRRGRDKKSGICCGSAADAAGFCKKVLAKTEVKPAVPKGPFDAQQTFVRRALLPYAERLDKSKDADADLPQCLFEAQTSMVRKIVDKMCGEVHEAGTIAVLGGIQINTPGDISDYFLPRLFLIFDNSGELVEDLSATFY